MNGLDSSDQSTGLADRHVLSVGDVVVALEVPEGRMTFSPREGASRFSTLEGEPDLTLAARRTDLSGWKGGELLFETRGSWHLTRESETLSFACFAPQMGPAPYVVARIDRGWTRGELLVNASYFTDDVAIDPLQFPLDEVLFTQLLARGRGILLHGCGIVVNGRGVVFAGHSGDGKSTTAGLWAGRPGARVINDDRVIVRPDGNGFQMCGTPWHGEGLFAEPVSVPLSAVFVLEKAPEVEVKTLGPVEAATALLARSFVPFHSAASLDWTLEFLDGLVSKVPCRTFRFRPDESAPALVERWLGELR